ncbi:hypothetical protein PIIN_11204 [Serendipita indica DSM 11827]|uniref:Uncharacterized protein n=1 Tax=Serendipita indica (strain DSM 11827) TaxID=1109443 RepID=G4U0X9_SERID|nr:hypothetical protein PIIN_11204 [Serendipita indica DSM 11827]
MNHVNQGTKSHQSGDAGKSRSLHQLQIFRSNTLGSASKPCI